MLVLCGRLACRTYSKCRAMRCQYAASACAATCLKSPHPAAAATSDSVAARTGHSVAKRWRPMGRVTNFDASRRGLTDATMSLVVLVTATLVAATPPASLTPSSVVIVGGSSGMGKAAAKQIVSRGGRVLL